MKDTSVKKEILNEIHKLGKGQQNGGAGICAFVSKVRDGRRTRQDSAALCRNDR